jgi:hypothetical protein
LVQHQRRRLAAWRRWAAKLPHNRVVRPPIRDDEGHRVGYGEPVLVHEPPLPDAGFRRVNRPSGRVELVPLGPVGADLRRLQEAYRLARRPVPTAADVPTLQVSMAEVRAWLADVGA